MNITALFRELQSLDPQNPGAWPRWARIGIAATAGVLVIAAGLYFQVREQVKSLETEQAKEVELRREFDRKQRKVAGLEAYKQQLAEMEQSFGAMLRQLPSKSEVANLINDISQTRIASGLDENLFQPEAEVMRDFYAEIPNRIVLVGDYHELGIFVSGIAALPRIVTIESVDLKPLGAGKAGKGERLKGDLLELSALAKTYRYLDESELPPPSKAAAPKGKGKPNTKAKGDS